MTITGKANIYSEMFESATRQDGKSFVKIKDAYTDNQTDESKALQESIHKAHGNRFPDDWVYGTYADLLQRIEEHELETIDDLEDVRNEIVDSYVDIYTHDLTAWLAEDVNNVYYVTKVIEDGTPGDGFQLLAMAQYKAIDEVMSEVINLLSEDREESE